MINQQKIQEWTEVFLKHIREIGPERHVNEEEGYKFKAVEIFQQNFDMAAPDFATMLETSIEDNNLAKGSWYFPRKMLLIFANEHPTETKEALRLLFDESKPVAERIDEVTGRFKHLMDVRNQKLNENSHSFIGIRFLSLLLGYRFPGIHNAIKPREWRVFCKYIDEDFKIPSHASDGEKYQIFDQYIKRLRDYIRDVSEIKNLRDQLTRGLVFRDEEFGWMAQNVIYVTARVLAGQYGKDDAILKEPITQEISEGDEEISEEMIFPKEENLESFIIKNWKSIFGDTLELYIDEDGTGGQQYTTDVGFIDILAKDTGGNLVVIELKRSVSGAAVIGQILAYMQWVQENLASENQKVRGIVIVSEGNKSLFAAQKAVADKIEIKYYRVNLNLISPS